MISSIIMWGGFACFLKAARRWFLFAKLFLCHCLSKKKRGLQVAPWDLLGWLSLLLRFSLLQREKKFISGQKRPVSPQKRSIYLYFNALCCVKISFLPFSCQPTTPRPVAVTIAKRKFDGICEIRPCDERTRK